MNLAAERAQRYRAHEHSDENAEGKKAGERQKGARKPARVPQHARGVAIEYSQFR